MLHDIETVSGAIVKKGHLGGYQEVKCPAKRSFSSNSIYTAIPPLNRIAAGFPSIATPHTQRPYHLLKVSKVLLLVDF